MRYLILCAMSVLLSTFSAVGQVNRSATPDLANTTWLVEYKTCNLKNYTEQATITLLSGGRIANSAGTWRLQGNKLTIKNVREEYIAEVNVSLTGDSGMGDGLIGMNDELKCIRLTQVRRTNGQSAIQNTPGPILSGRLLFSSRRDGNQEVYALDAATRKESNLTNNAADDGYPKLSPDGRRIAFASNRDGYWTIYLMKPDGTQPVKLLKDRSESGYHDWSPDSRSLVFAASRPGDGKDEIYVIGADGSSLRKLTNHPPEDVHPAWSPDGRKIAFASERDGNRRIYLMNADGSGLVCLTNDRWYSDYPAWSPDGSRIAFASDRDSKASSRLEIYVMSADGTGVRRITNHTADDRHPCWSPDGKMLAFASDRLGDRDIFTINADGSAPAVLARAAGDDEHPHWSLAAAYAAEATPKAAEQPPRKESFRQRLGRAIKEGATQGLKDGLGITEAELRRQLYEQMVADGEVNRQSCAESGENDPVKLLETERVDLNGDGIPEIKVFGRGCACQGARRCMQWLYRKSGAAYELLASVNGADEIALLRTSTNGYRDLNVLYPPGNNNPGWNEVYRFDGRRYLEPRAQQSTQNRTNSSLSGPSPATTSNQPPTPYEDGGVANAQAKSMTGTVIDYSVGNRGTWAGITIKVGNKKYFVSTWSTESPTPKIVGKVDEVGRSVQVFYTRIVNSPGFDGELRATRIVEVGSSSQRVAPRDSHSGGPPAATTSNQPPTPYEDIGACPFECCRYRQWTVSAQTTVRQERRNDSPAAFTLRRGEKVMGLTGVVITTQPGQARILKATVIGGIQVRSGEIIHLLTYVGEGFYKVWYKGKVEQLEIEGTGGFTIIREPEAVWWVKVKNSRGQIGWTDQTKNFSGMDACG